MGPGAKGGHDCRAEAAFGSPQGPIRRSPQDRLAVRRARSAKVRRIGWQSAGPDPQKSAGSVALMVGDGMGSIAAGTCGFPRIDESVARIEIRGEAGKDGIRRRDDESRGRPVISTARASVIVY